MMLSKVQAASLKRLQKYRAESPTLRERLRLVAGFLLLLLVLAVIAVYLGVRLGLPYLAWAVAGIYIGAVAREIGNQRLFVKWWSLNREITDWQKVEELLNASSDSSATVKTEPARKLQWKRAAVVGVAAFAVIFGLAVAAERTLAFVHDPTRNNSPDNVIVLSASWCGYCMSLRQHLAERGIPYTDLDVEQTAEGRWAYFAVRGTGVPITIVGNQVLRGAGKAGAAPWEKVDRALVGAGYPVAGVASSP